MGADMTGTNAGEIDDTQAVLQANIDAMCSSDEMRLWNSLREAGAQLIARLPDGRDIELILPGDAT